MIFILAIALLIVVLLAGFLEVAAHLAADVYCLPSNLAVFSGYFTDVAARHVVSHGLRFGEHVILDCRLFCTFNYFMFIKHYS